MIRLSRQVAFEVSKDSFARDLDAQPYLHMYRADVNKQSNVILVQGDDSTNRSTTRNNAFAPFWNNVLLGTSNFYPDKGLGLVNYHTNSRLQDILSDPILPTINYKKATLYFNQGSLSDSSILGYTLRLYCLDKKGFEISLLSMVDFKNNSNVVAKTPKYFESQIFNEGINVEYIDVEYLLNSNDSEVQEVKELFFGSHRPDRIYIEYAPIWADSVDDFDKNGYIFTSINATDVNEQSLPISFVGSGEDLYNEISLSNDNRAIRSQLKHTRFNVADFLETQKESEQYFEIKHIFSINVYDGDNNLIESFGYSIENVADVYDDVIYRPILDTNADHAKVDCSVKIENAQTGMIYSISSSIVLTPDVITGFKTQPDINLVGINVNKVSNTVNRVVNQIVQRNETPNIVTVEKKVYIQSQQAGSIVLFDGNFTAKIMLQDGLDVSGAPKFKLKIGTLTMESLESDPLLFNIPKEAYNNDHGNTYTLLDVEGQVITTGALVRKTYPTVSTDIADQTTVVGGSKTVNQTPKSIIDASISKFDQQSIKSSKLSFDFVKGEI